MPKSGHYSHYEVNHRVLCEFSHQGTTSSGSSMLPRLDKCKNQQREFNNDDRDPVVNHPMRSVCRIAVCANKYSRKWFICTFCSWILEKKNGYLKNIFLRVLPSSFWFGSPKTRPMAKTSPIVSPI